MDSGSGPGTSDLGCGGGEGGGGAEDQPSASGIGTAEGGGAGAGAGSGAGGGAEGSTATAPPSRYESQKRRDWTTFLQYLRNHRPPLTLPRCSGAHVIEFLKYLDQFGKTKVHVTGCPHFGHPNPPAPCACPLKQAWGSLDALIGRLRAAYEEHDGRPESNPFAARAVRIYLREVKDDQAKARGVPYEKKRKRSTITAASESGSGNNGRSGGGGRRGDGDDTGGAIVGPPAATTSTA